MVRWSPFFGSRRKTLTIAKDHDTAVLLFALQSFTCPLCLSKEQTFERLPLFPSRPQMLRLLNSEFSLQTDHFKLDVAGVPFLTDWFQKSSGLPVKLRPVSFRDSD